MEFATLECEAEDNPIQHSAVNPHKQLQDDGERSADEAMTQGADTIAEHNRNEDTPTYTMTDDDARPQTPPLDVNGGIDNDDLLEMMSG